MLRRTPLRRKTPLRAKLASAGKRVASWRRRYTGPDQATRLLVWDRCGGYCEFGVCHAGATEVHHRLSRKAGGRKGEMAERINRPGNLMAGCNFHHRMATSAHGDTLTYVRDMGWVLQEGQEPCAVPVKTRHGWVYLDDDGGWHRQ